MEIIAATPPAAPALANVRAVLHELVDRIRDGEALRAVRRLLARQKEVEDAVPELSLA